MWTSLVPLPYRWAIIAALFAAAFGFGWVKGAGHVRAEWSAADAQHARHDAEQHANATEHARQQEQLLRAALDAQEQERSKENADHAKQLETLRAAARAGTERLRCPAAIPAEPAQAADSGAAARPEPEARPGELVPRTADDLFRIGASIASIVRERNALIDKYNAARETCNAQ